MAETSNFPEGAAEYLSNTNFKSLMEWMTAEVRGSVWDVASACGVLARPDLAAAMLVSTGS